eukprot:1153306-Pelagomonas_calceolata.AAC.2
MQKCFEEKKQDRKDKGTWHAFHLGVLLGHTYYMQMCAPAKVTFQLLGCEHVNESALCSQHALA